MADKVLKGKSEIVTGGSRSIGQAVALALATRGANILFNYRDSKAAADQLVAELERQGVKAVAFQADLEDPEAPRSLVEHATDAFGRLDILVNNAGVAALEALGTQSDWAAADRMWAINTQAVVSMIRAAAEVMEDGGRIVSIGSVSGTKAGMPTAADYCVSKAAIAGYTRRAAHDLGSRKITINAIEAGMINNDMAHGIPKADKARLSAAIPLGRSGEPEEIAWLICYLASPEAAYINGATLTIDGGASA